MIKNSPNIKGGSLLHIGVPKEIKNNEGRVALVPGGVRGLVEHGHKIFIESGAGRGIGIEDHLYEKSGATILKTAEEIFRQGEMIIKVKEPLESEIRFLEPHHILYTYLHLAANKKLTIGLMQTGSSCIAYETIQEEDLSLPLLTPMSEVAGRMATQIGATYLQKDHGGKGILLGGVPGTRRGRVTVIGAGISGMNAIKMALGMGADVTAIDISTKRLAKLDQIFNGHVTTLFSNPQNIEETVIQSDLIVGAVLIPGAKAPCLVTRQMVSQMEKGSVIVDISVDQGGCIETCRPTTHENPTFTIDGVIHYCVSNIPGAVARTSTYALTNVTLKYAQMMASLGLEDALKTSPALQKGVNIFKGHLVYSKIAKDLDISCGQLQELLS